MKKNLISVIILALVFANFVLTALLLFTVLPQTKKANQMIEDVCAAIDLELNSGDASGPSNVKIEDQEIYKLNGGEKMTMTFAPSQGDSKDHHLIANFSLTMNKKSDGYSAYGPTTLTEQEERIKNLICGIIDNYDVNAFKHDKDTVYKEILMELQKMYGGDFIVGVNVSEVLTD